MFRFRDMPVARKVGLAVVLASALSLTMAVGAFAWREVRSYRHHAVDRLRTLAEVLAANSAAALLFDDADAAARTLASLASQPRVDGAWLLRPNGRVFARYGADGPPPRPEEGAEAVRWEGRWLVVARPVRLDDEPLGWIVIREHAGELVAQLWWGAGVALGIFGLAVVVAWAVSLPLRRRISAPIRALAEAMERVGESGDLNVRVPGRGRDEVGTLIRGFNRMLEQIADRDERLGRLAAAVDQAAEGIVVTDPDGQIQYANRAFRALVGLGEEGGTGINLFSLYPTDEPRVDELRDAAEHGRVWSGRLRALRADGSWYHEECALSPVKGAGGEVHSLVVVKRDVTREVEFEARLAQNQKLEALGTLAGGVAHDFNNVLTPILGYAELALNQVEANTRLHGNLSRILRAAERAKGLVDQILAFSRQSEDTRVALRFGELLQETEELLRASIPKRVRLAVRWDAGEDGVVGNPTQLQQVVMNLVTNACHAMEPEGGTVEIGGETVEVREPEPDLAAGRYLVLRVTDEGCGMPPEVQARIFEPFFTTKEVGKGTGLGLAAVHGIVKQHGGAIRVDSVVGRGTTFRVYLPLAGRADRVEERVGARETMPRGRGERILVVDDEIEVADFLAQTLETLGYRVEAVLSAEEAWQRFSRSPGAVDLLLTDQTMPGRTGLELARQCRERRPDLPVVLCTGYASAVATEELAAAGVAVLLAKPVSPRQLAAEVRRVLDGGKRP